MAAPKNDICITCNEPRKKNFPLYKCTTCGKLVHRKCAVTTSSSHTFNCMKCVNNKKEKVGVSSASNRASLTKSNNTPTTTQKATSIRNASHNIIQSRRSNTINTEKTSSCNCLDVLRKELAAWEHKIQENLSSLFDSIKQQNENAISSMLNEIAGLRRIIQPVLDGKLHTSPPAGITNEAKQQTHKILHTNSNIKNSNNVFSHQNLYSNCNLASTSNSTLNLDSNNINNNFHNNFNNKYTNDLNTVTDSSITRNFQNNQSCSPGSSFTQVPDVDSKSVDTRVTDTQNIGSTHDFVAYNPFVYPSNNNTVCATIRPQDYEIFIAGFMHLSESDNVNLLCFSILCGIVPSIAKQEIISTRLITRLNSNKFPSIIVRLTSAARTKQLLLTLKERNYYSTQDIDKSILQEEFSSRIPSTKIIINDVLSSSDYKKYLALKPIAKNLGFTFVWHCGGKFLVRWKHHQRAYSFNSVSDLNAIRDIYTDKHTLEQRRVLVQSTSQTDDKNVITGDPNNSNQN